MLALLAGVIAQGAAVDAVVLERVAETRDLRQFRMVPGVPIISDEQYEQVASGHTVTGLEVVEGVAARKAYGVAVLDQPIAVLWAAINDDQGQVDHGEIGYSELLAGEACKSGRKVLELLPLPIVSDRWWITNLRWNVGLERKSDGRVRELAWQSSDDFHMIPVATRDRLKGVPITFNKGGWFLIDLDGKRTLAEYYVWTDPAGSIPAGPAAMFASGSIKQAFRDIEELARVGPGCPVD